MKRLPLCLAVVGMATAFAAASATPVSPTPRPPSSPLTTPAAGTVTDAEVLRLLRTAYPGEAVSLKSEWRARDAHRANDEPPPSVRTVCADSGAQTYGPRLVAVCASFEDAGHAQPGEVDLFQLLDPRGAQMQARIGARERGLQSGGWGSPGDVKLVEIGSGRTAFALSSGFTNMGWTTESVSLHQADDDRFVERLTFATHLDNSGDCDPDGDRGCRARSVSLDCTLRVDPAKADRGFYALSIDVAGERAGRKVERSIPTTFDGTRYRAAPRALVRDGCDQDG
ncbi:MAG: hypothetical protein ACTHOH_00305 [Lysobacteraceae bacterium]